MALDPFNEVRLQWLVDLDRIHSELSGRTDLLGLQDGLVLFNWRLRFVDSYLAWLHVWDTQWIFSVSLSSATFLSWPLKNLISFFKLLLWPSAVNFGLAVELRETHWTGTSILYAKLFFYFQNLILLFLVVPLHFSNYLFNFSDQTAFFFHRQLVQLGPHSFCIHVLALHQFCEIFDPLFALVFEVLLQLFSALILVISV